MESEKAKVIRDLIREIVLEQSIIGKIEIKFNGEKGVIQNRGEVLEVSGSEILLAECLRIMRKSDQHSLHVVNASNYVRKESKKSGLEPRTKK